MAKISANGATEVARLKVQAGSSQLLLVMCSDGRVLKRYLGPAGTGYTVHGRVKTEANRTADMLLALSARMGWEPVP